MSDGFSFQTGHKRSLEVIDYVLFSLLFVISSVVGFYHAYKRRHTTTEDEFNFAGRSLHPVPVGMSLAATYFSAVTILGVPAEIYTNNTMMMWSLVASFLSTVFVAHLFAPFFHSLNITSCYEYIEKRFCRPLRLVASSMFILQTSMYLGIVLYLPCLAMQAVTDLSMWYTMVVVCVVCVLYTTLGGMRSVVWVDTLQLLVIVAGLIAAFIGGANATGGIGNAWRIATERDRIQLDEFSVDPRTRHTIWNIVIGYSIFLTYINGLNQLQIQRICTVDKTSNVKVAVWLSYPLYVVIQTLVCLTGVVMFAFYSECHPVSYGLINKNDQLLPLFVLDVLGTVPGMPGLFIACVFSGCLSTMSSCLNTISTAILEDFIKPFCCRKFSSRNGVLLSRCLVFAVGCVMFAMAVLVSEIAQLVLQLTTTVQGTFIGSLMGLFVCGMFLPWTNSKGAATGLVVSLLFMLWLILGSIVEGPTGRKPLSTSTKGCNWNVSSSFIATDALVSLSSTNNDTYTLLNTGTMSDTISDEPVLHNFYHISYMWYSGLGLFVNILVTVVVSFLTGFNDPSTIDSRLICPIFDRLFPWLPEYIRRPLRCGVVYKKKYVGDVSDVGDVEDKDDAVQSTSLIDVTKLRGSVKNN